MLIAVAKMNLSIFILHTYLVSYNLLKFTKITCYISQQGVCTPTVVTDQVLIVVYSCMGQSHANLRPNTAGERSGGACTYVPIHLDPWNITSTFLERVLWKEQNK